MFEVVASVLPIFLLIILGWIFKRSPLIEEYGWKALERVTYYVLFPCLLASTLADADFSELAMKGVAGSIIGATGLVTVLLLATRSFFNSDGPAFTSIYQGAVRMNTYIGLSIANAFYGVQGLAASALAIAIIVPLVNIACVLMLAWYGSATNKGWRGVFDAFLKNPLILGAFAGLALNVSGMGMPPVIGPMAEILADAALPLGLLAVGAALQLKAVQESGMIVLATAAIKLLALPLVTYELLQFFGVSGIEGSIAILFNALPTATSSYILASQYGGDARLMASITSSQTLLSMVTLPLVISYLM
jgi:predicted permease